MHGKVVLGCDGDADISDEACRCVDMKENLGFHGIDSDLGLSKAVVIITKLRYLVKEIL